MTTSGPPTKGRRKRVRSHTLRKLKPISSVERLHARLTSKAALETLYQSLGVSDLIRASSAPNTPHRAKHKHLSATRRRVKERYRKRRP